MPQPTTIQSQMSDAFHSPEFCLHASIRDNNLTRLQQLIDSLTPTDLREHLDEDDGYWGMPLHVAVTCDCPAAVGILLRAGASPLSVKFGGDDAPTPLAIAARQGNGTLVRQLWQQIDPDRHASNHQGFQSCLVYAAMYGQVSVVTDLLDWWDGWSAKAQELALSGAAMRWRVYVVKVLLSKFPFEQQTLDHMLYVAADFMIPLAFQSIAEYQGVDYFEQQLLIELLVDAGADPNTTLNRVSPLQMAAGNLNLVGALKVLLEKGADPNATNEAGDSALHRLGFPVLIHRNLRKRAFHETGIRLLLEKNASVYQKNKSGETPLHYAACGSNLRILQLYLSACPSEDDRNALIRSTNHHGEGILHFAAAGCKLDILQYLFSHAGMEANINDANSNGWTPLMCALAQTSRPTFGSISKRLSQVMPVARLLLAHGADSLVATTEGWTPLHCLALYLGNDISDETMQLIDNLISAGADVNARALFPVEAPPPPGRSRSYCRTVFGWGHQVEEVIKDPAEEGMMIRYGLTPLHFAATHGALGVAEALLRHGANPSAEDSSEASPARTAGESTRLKNHIETQDKIITLLMDAGGSY